MATKTMEWHYIRDADLTIGEVKISKTAKILLILLVVLLAIAGAVGYYFRYTIYDYVVNPDILLVDEKIVLQVNSEFIPENYVVSIDKYNRVDIIYPDASEVNTEITGEYVVEYISKNSIRENRHQLIVVIVDDEPPVIELTTNLVILTRGDETKKFDPTTYISKIYDNYDKEEDLIITYEKTFDWSKDVIELHYSVKDSSGLEGFAVLNIVINDEPHVHEWDSGKVTIEATYDSEGEKLYTCKICGETYKETLPKVVKPVETPKPTAAPTDSPQQTTPPQETTQPQETPKPQPTQPPVTPAPQQNTPYINGVHDVTVRVGTDFGSFIAQLTSGVQGSGYVTVNYSSVNLTMAGSYTVTFTSDDGVTKTCTVTVVD